MAYKIVDQSWLHLIVRTSAANIDAVSNFLFERGSSGVVVRRNAVETYFPDSSDVAALKNSVHRFVRDLAKRQSRGRKPRIRWNSSQPGNWQNAWKRFIKPRRIGKIFWVTPPWLTPPRFRHRKVITIEPGMAFGTGIHGTTRGCMEFLELVAAHLPQGKFTALDVGTGSGILAIALAKLGAKKVWAIDNDPVALDVARENLRNNDAADRVHLTGTMPSGVRKRFSIVVANLTAETIMELAGAIQGRVAPKGYLILSGILQPRANAVARRFCGKFRIVKRKRSREWVTLLLRRR